MQINVAVVQFGIQPFAPAETLAEAELRVQQASVRIEQFIKKASSRADIIVFPENFLTVVLGDKVLADYESRYVQHFQRLAAEYNIDLVPGSFIEGDQDGLYNTTYYIDKTGSIRGKYRKINLWHHERLLLSPWRRNLCLRYPIRQGWLNYLLGPDVSRSLSSHASAGC